MAGGEGGRYSDSEGDIGYEFWYYKDNSSVTGV
jgi:hypothetical protein